ncbi:hypothetical protein [Sphingomonas hylomeconis]|uniref:Lipoprotein n=1 Tax=Sphingomonas hylomeconis TaxID=1395958 RepID=A0ABV7SWT0_9SPHN|nr:hypothetical protein [Sphingomonas hylomeconis]
MKIVALTTLALTLAACSGPTEPPKASNETQAEVAPTGDVGIVAPTGVTNATLPSPRPTPTPSPQATMTTAAPRTFPVAFRGRWGMNANDCDPKRDDNKGLITISADAIRFYESRATIAKLDVSSPTRIGTDLSFSGEGQTWQSRSVFDLSGGGTKLARTEEEPAGAFVYARCPA